MNPRSTWALRLRAADAQYLGALRRWPEVDAWANGDDVWVRGPALQPELEVELSKLPALERFDIQPDGRLLPAGSRIPRGALPSGNWRPLAKCLQPKLAQCALPGELQDRVALRLVRSGTEATASVLLTTLADWKDWAATAAEMRLRPLSFAVNDADQVIVRGSILPPLPGQRFVDHGGVAVAAGFTWEPAIDAAILRKWLRLGPGVVALWQPDAPICVIFFEQWMPASRSAARLSGRTADV